MAVFEKLLNNTLREQISARIKQAIFTGDLREGDRLVERKLTIQFETSLTAVREALVQLEAEGFVTKKANSATHVSKYSLEAAEKISRVRRVLETYAVEEAATCATPEQIRDLENSYLELLDAARSENVEAYQCKDLALHEKIWELTSNEYLVTALKRIVYPMFAIAAIRLVSCRPFDLMQDTYSHLAIVDAIKQKNPERAKQAFLAAMNHWSDEQAELDRDEVQKEAPSLVSH